MTDSAIEPTTATPGPSTAKAVVLIAVVGLFSYYNSLHGVFVFDDYLFLTDPHLANPLKSQLAPRPVIAFSLALNYWLDGDNPRGYHLFNITVHVLAAVVLFDLVRRTLLLPRFAGRFDAWAGWVGLVSALIWLAHPLQTQAVTYIVQRCESLMGLFFLLGFWCFVCGATAHRGRGWYVAAFVACALGAGCKEMMITLPMLAFLYDRTFLSGSWWAAIRARWKVLLALSVPPLVGVGTLVLTGFLNNPTGTVGFGVKFFTPYSYALTESEVILHYLKLTFWPVGQALDYIDWPVQQSLVDAWPTVTAIGVMLLAVLIGVLARSSFGFLGAWFVLILAPTSSFIPIQDAAFEHRMYLPLVAVVVMVVGGLACLATEIGRRAGTMPLVGRVAGSLAGAVVVLLAILTIVRNEDYSSAERLYADNVAKRPANARARLSLAVQLFAAGKVAQADEQLDAALRLPLKLPSLQTERIKVLRESGRPKEAVVLAADLLATKPDDLQAGYEYGLSLLVDDRPVEAEPYLRRMAEGTPQNKFARIYYGIALLQVGRLADADIELRASDNLDPSYAAQLAQTARRTALDPNAKPSNIRLVRWYAIAACRMKPAASAEFHDTLSICLARVSLFAEAKIEAEHAADLARNRGDAYLASRYEDRARKYAAGRSSAP